MSESNQKPINPFLMAKRLPVVMASLRVADVLALRPDWTTDQAEAFLATHAAVIAYYMLQAATAAAAKLAEVADHAS